MSNNWTDSRKLAKAIRDCGLIPCLTPVGWGVRFSDEPMPAWTNELWPDDTDVPESLRWLDGYPSPPARNDRGRDPYRIKMLESFTGTAVPRATGEAVPPDVIRGERFWHAFDKACVMVAFDSEYRPKATLENVVAALELYGVGRIHRTERGRVKVESYGCDPTGSDAPMTASDAVSYLRGIVLRWFFFDPGRKPVKECLDMALALGGVGSVAYALKNQGDW